MQLPAVGNQQMVYTLQEHSARITPQQQTTELKVPLVVTRHHAASKAQTGVIDMQQALLRGDI